MGTKGRAEDDGSVCLVPLRSRGTSATPRLQAHPLCVRNPLPRFHQPPHTLLDERVTTGQLRRRNRRRSP